MNKPKKPTLPTRPSKPNGEPKTKVMITEHIPSYGLDIIGRLRPITEVIKQLQTIANGRDPDKVMLHIRQDHGYYEHDSHIEITCTEQKEIENPHYEKQLRAFNKSMDAYEAKLVKHDAQMKQYVKDIEQYDYDMKAYYDWVVAQKKVKG